MERNDVSRRTVLKGGGAALAGFTVSRVAGPAQAFQDQDASGDELPRLRQPLGQPGDVVLPWLDQPEPNPAPGAVGNFLKWEELDSWYTPADNFFFITHYGVQTGLDAATWRVGITGLVHRPQSLTLDEIKARPRHEVDFSIECSGDNGFPFAVGLIGNARWAGARLAPLLQHAGLMDEATEVIFWGFDRGTVTIRDNVGILRGGQTGVTTPDDQGGLDLTITEHFARSMSVHEALNRDNLLCYEMNGVPLPPEHGFPVRLIAPGWYGVANVKWLTHIEVVDQRFAGRFMARDYVTIREQQRDGETVWTFLTVGHDRLKSAPAKVVQRAGAYVVLGAAWGAPIAAVEVQIDGGAWMPATLYDPAAPKSRSRGYAWRFWSFTWGTPAAGEHTVTSRAYDTDGNLQPSPTDPFIANKVTYWESTGWITRRVLIP